MALEKSKNLSSSFLEKIRSREDIFFKKVRRNTKETYLNLNGGAKVLKGFINIDPYYSDEYVFNYYLGKLPFKDSSVSGIYCSFLMDNLPRSKGRIYFKEWYRVLEKDGGVLLLTIPDISKLMKSVLDPTLSDSKRRWFSYLLSGNISLLLGEESIPLDMSIPHNDYFTKSSLLDYLWYSNFKVKNLFSYESENGPSLWVEAYA